MNKKKIFISVIFTLMIMLVGIKCVKAEELIAFLECEYAVDYQKEDTFKDSASHLHVGYTELKDDEGKNFYIQGRTTDISSFGDIHDGWMIDIGVDIIGDGLTTTYSTFQSAFVANGRKCPTYLVIDYRDTSGILLWKERKYNAKFYNDLKGTSCENPSDSLCQGYLKNTRELGRIDIDSDEDYWYYDKDNPHNEACSKLHVDILVRNRQLNAKLTYASDSKCLDCLANQQKDRYIVMDGINFNQIYNFVAKNDPNVFYINPLDTASGGLEYVNFGNNYDGDNKCLMTRPGPFSTGKLCITQKELYYTFNHLNDLVNRLYPNNSAIYNDTRVTSSKCDESGSCKRFARSYSNYTKQNQIQGVLDIIEGAKEVDQTAETNLLNEINALLDGTSATMNGKLPCNSAKEAINNIKKALAEKQKIYAEQYKVIGEALAKAQERAEEIGAEPELLDEMQVVREDMDKEVDRVYEALENLELELIKAEDIKLHLEASGCFILSNEFIEFLKTVLWYIRIAGVVLAIILSLVDYIKASIGSDDKSMAAANKKFITRILLVAILFLIPVLLEFLLGTLNVSTTAGSLECLNR